MSEGSRRRVLPVSQGQSEANQGAGAGPRGGPVKCLLHECEDLSLFLRTRVKRLGMEAGLYSQCRSGNGWADSRSLVPSEPNLLGELQASERPCLNRAPEEQHLRLISCHPPPPQEVLGVMAVFPGSRRVSPGKPVGQGLSPHHGQSQLAWSWPISPTAGD